MVDAATSTASEIARQVTDPNTVGNYLAYISITLAAIILIPGYLQIIQQRTIAQSAILAINIILTTFLVESILIAIYCLRRTSGISKLFIIFPLCTMFVALIIVWIYYYSKRPLGSPSDED